MFMVCLAWDALFQSVASSPVSLFHSQCLQQLKCEEAPGKAELWVLTWMVLQALGTLLPQNGKNSWTIIFLSPTSFLTPVKSVTECSLSGFSTLIS